MTRAALLLFAFAAAFGLGALAGARSRRAWERAALPPRRVRPPAVEAALVAWEERGEPPVVSATDLDPESAADVAFLRAAASGEDQALLDMARRHDGRDASARALWTLAERTPDARTQEARRKAFADRWPNAWVVGTASSRSP